MSSDRKYVIVTGMSGAGRSAALKMLEDAGFFCVDNLPVPFLTKFFEMSGDLGMNAAVGLDCRAGKGIETLEDKVSFLKEKNVKILFLEASDEILIRRYKETRRTHPLAGVDRVEDGITRERKRIAFLKQNADYIIDTSRLITRELRAELYRIFVQNGAFSNFQVTVLSFGYKYGIPADADLVFDVRFLPNPFYIPELKKLTGNDKPVHDYVMDSEKSRQFLDKLTDMIDFLIPNYMDEGKTNLVIAIGCTGGQHRSVTIANELYEWLSHTEYNARLEHRELH